jgi:hypothetical protein
MIRLLVPLAGFAVFFLLSLVTVRTVQPRQPRLFFLAYALALLAASAFVYVRIWPLESFDDGVGLLACLLLQLLMCLTMWNAFYSLLWGFSGGLVHDLYNEVELRHVDRLVRSYERQTGLDRILARRLPGLEAGGYIERQGDAMRLRWKGRLIALGTLAAFKTFSLGMGGGVNRLRNPSTGQE